MNRSERIAEQLGMPHGTATNKLRKIILFSLLQKSKEDVCIRCGKIIQGVEDLSIEHIKPWEGVSADLFWDLGNISFSHVGCNRPHSYPRKQIQAPSGKNWCFVCKDFRNVEDFHDNSSKASGLADRCKNCKSEENGKRIRS